MITDTFKTYCESDTENAACKLASAIPAGSVIALHGNLGAGKTVFARGFARGLGITQPVSSPTFTLVQEYPLENGRWLYHLDMYRIDDYRAALAFGVDEYFDDKDAVVLVEWAERVAEILPDDLYIVNIKRLDGDTREITVESPSK